MMVAFRGDAWRDHVGWQSEDAKVLKRINALIGECLRDPFKGIGKPVTGWWSRRITGEYRLVYRLRGSGEGQLSCRYHY